MKDYSKWQKYNGAYNGSGRSEKIWLQNPENPSQIGLFKYRKDSNTTDHVSEYLAYKIACVLQIDCAEFQIASYNGNTGSFCFNFLHEGETLLEGIHFIQKYYPTYDMERLCDEFEQHYSLEIIEKALTYYSESYFTEFLKIPVFDFLIGNSDRHQNNWGFIQNNTVSSQKKLKLAPLYDNSSSLCAYTNGITYKDVCKDMRRWQSIVDNKSLSMIRIYKSDIKRPRHTEVMEYLFSDKYRAVIEPLCEKIVHEIDCCFIDNLFNDKELVDINNERLELIKFYLLEKVALLKKIQAERQ